MSSILFKFICIILFNCVHSNFYKSTCNVSEKCVPFNNCESVKSNVRNDVVPKVCGFFNEPYICCLLSLEIDINFTRPCKKYEDCVHYSQCGIIKGKVSTPCGKEKVCCKFSDPLLLKAKIEDPVNKNICKTNEECVPYLNCESIINSVRNGTIPVTCEDNSVCCPTVLPKLKLENRFNKCKKHEECISFKKCDIAQKDIKKGVLPISCGDENVCCPQSVTFNKNNCEVDEECVLYSNCETAQIRVKNGKIPTSCGETSYVCCEAISPKPETETKNRNECSLLEECVPFLNCLVAQNGVKNGIVPKHCGVNHVCCPFTSTTDMENNTTCKNYEECIPLSKCKSAKSGLITPISCGDTNICCPKLLASSPPTQEIEYRIKSDMCNSSEECIPYVICQETQTTNNQKPKLCGDNNYVCCPLLSPKPEIDNLQSDKCGVFEKCLPFNYCAQAKFIIQNGGNATFCGSRNGNDYVCCWLFEDDNKFGVIAKKKCELYAKETKLLVAVGVEEMDKISAGNFPHMAALGYGDVANIEWFCAGSLISDNYVLTAAHCILSPHGEVSYVQLGDIQFLSGPLTNQKNGLIIKVNQTFPHTLYSYSSINNDIGLIKLEKSIEFTSYIKPACLLNQMDGSKENTVIATGWNNKNNKAILQKLDMIISDNCDSLPNYITRKLNKETMDSFCAGSLYNSNNNCQNDTGGPLQRLDFNYNLYTIIGVTSLGKMCSFSGIPGVYTNVSKYVSWIESVVWPNNNV